MAQERGACKKVMLPPLWQAAGADRLAHDRPRLPLYTWERCCSVAQSCPTLCDSTDSSTPGPLCPSLSA